jgi:hypothetical protein
MSREAHVRSCESGRGRFPPATRLIPRIRLKARNQGCKKPSMTHETTHHKHYIHLWCALVHQD